MKKIILILLGIIVSLSIVVAIIYHNNKNKGEEIEEDIELEEDINIENKIETNDNTKKIFVDIKGMIKTPGVYEVNIGSRVNDIIKLAGGLTNDADTSLINLAKIVEDEMTIIIYSKKEVLDKLKDEICVCNCPLINNDACIKEESNNKIIVNINSASKEELLNIPGIGESKADEIIKYRKEKGLFKVPEDIKNVTGIGDALFTKIKDYIKV